eukprot:2807754-Rhodomonas_salina.2
MSGPHVAQRTRREGALRWMLPAPSPFPPLNPLLTNCLQSRNFPPSRRGTMSHLGPAWPFRTGHEQRRHCRLEGILLAYVVSDLVADTVKAGAQSGLLLSIARKNQRSSECDHVEIDPAEF